MHWDIIMSLVSNKRRENALDNEAYSLNKTCVAMKISHWQTGFPFYWDTRYRTNKDFILAVIYLAHYITESAWINDELLMKWYTYIIFSHLFYQKCIDGMHAKTPFTTCRSNACARDTDFYIYIFLYIESQLYSFHSYRSVDCNISVTAILLLSRLSM